jgi:D-alanyl-lipoteichoic acid acyltransferase DltB (MBOAT superfamily)
MLFMVSHGLIGLTFVIGVTYFLSLREPLSRIIAPWVLHDLGNLLLAFVMLWAYMSFAQFLIIWVENLQHEIPWYLHRINGGWGAIAVALIVLQFALPFILLLSRVVKRKAGTLCAVAVAIALMHQIELFWFVAPTFHPDGFSLHWTTLLAPLGIGGLWFAAFLGQLRDRPLLPFRDPRFIAIVEEQGWVPHG